MSEPRWVRDALSEREYQEVKFPNQHLPNGTDASRYSELEWQAKRIVDLAVECGELTWLHVLDEEVKEAFAETDRAKLRAELIQVIAVAGRWIEDIERSATLDVMETS